MSKGKKGLSLLPSTQEEAPKTSTELLSSTSLPPSTEAPKAPIETQEEAPKAFNWAEAEAFRLYIPQADWKAFKARQAKSGDKATLKIQGPKTEANKTGELWFYPMSKYPKPQEEGGEGFLTLRKGDWSALKVPAVAEALKDYLRPVPQEEPQEPKEQAQG